MDDTVPVQLVDLPQFLPSPIGLLDAVTSAGARVGVANPFTATILRVFRRTRPVRAHDGDVDEGDCQGLGRSVSEEVLRRAGLAGTQRSQRSSWR